MFGEAQGHSPTIEQAHVGSDLLTQVSYHYIITSLRKGEDHELSNYQ